MLDSYEITRILIAGDEPLLPPECLILLEARGYHPLSCFDYDNAEAFILEDPPDLLLIERGFAGGRDVELIDLTRACLRKAFIPVLLAMSEDRWQGTDWQIGADDVIVLPVSPEHLLGRIRLAETRRAAGLDVDPLTGLPGGTSIIRAVRQAVTGETGVGICYLDIDNFKPYNDHFGFARGDDVIQMTARILVSTLDALAGRQGFVGHAGGDDFVFIVDEEKMTGVCEAIINNFTAARDVFFSRRHLESGGYTVRDRQGRDTKADLLTLSIAVINAGGKKIGHYGEAAAAAGQLLRYVKTKPGSNFLIDRRCAYTPR